MSRHVQKSSLSPFMAVTFAAVAFTGILMLFHLRIPGVHSFHEWAGLIFTIAAAIHLSINWRVFTAYFKNSKAAIGVAIAILILALIALAAPQGNHGNGYQGGGRNGYGFDGRHRR